MQDTEKKEQNKRRRLATLCVFISVLLHILCAWLLLQLPPPQPPPRHERAIASRILQIRKAKKTPPPAEAKQEQPPPIVKTSPDRPQQKPDQADFRGKHNSRAEGESDAPRKKSDAPLPGMMGEKKEELNTVDQERQDGPVEHDGRAASSPTPPPTEQSAPGLPEQPPAPQPEQGDSHTSAPAEATPTALPRPAQEGGDMKLQPTEIPETAKEHPQEAAPATGIPDASAPAPKSTRPKIRRPVYDPSLADHAQQPGLRTTERRSRSNGRFVLGRDPALNVSATPMGRYEMLVYRLIAARWYAACDEHRGDIIPGRIIIAFRLNKRGNVENMNLVTRRGAGVIQQGFTFRAIRSAQLPPMPTDVQRELIGEQLELIFTFNFD